MGIYDVPAAMLIEEAAKGLKARIKQPAFAPYVKTGAHRERAPNNPDWFYARAASILYRVYREKSLGTGALRSYYGGRKNRGVRPEHKAKASGKVIRSALQALEKDGLLKKAKSGRVITQKGEKFLFEKARAAEAAFKATMEKEKAEFAERLAKAEEARKKAAEARAAAEAARKQAEEKKAAELKAAQKAAEEKAQKPGDEKGQPQKPDEGKAEQKDKGQKADLPGKDYAPIG